MSKRAEEAALKAYPECKVYNDLAMEYDDINGCYRVGFEVGYEQAEKETIERACKWLKAHTKSYVGPIEEPFWTMFIEHFKKAMEDE